ncbi:MAG: HAD hydrolase-like protein [Puniceicoccales bacterium]|jgi:FMN phosphatase YigB (HAD superfamily)|nr:HAD hydrolase-like protein [Puniceicoccales bacterium]
MSKRLFPAAREFDVILVDFFDTIVHRRVHPGEVIRLWAGQVRACAGILCDAAELYAIRMQALEKFDRHLLNYSNIDWMREVHTRLRNSLLFREEISFERFFEISMGVEERLEIQSQFPNEDVLGPLRELRKLGKKIHVVSDFYLPKESLSRFLRAIGAREIFDEIFVSCDLAKTKSDGSLYPAVLERLNVKAAQAFMIGDNRRSDCVNSARHGIASFQLRHRHNNLLRKAVSRLLGLGTTRRGFRAAWKKHERACRGSRFAFSEYVLPFYFFTASLFEQLRRRGIRDAVFLSREGWMLKRFFETYQDIVVPPGERIRAHYLQMSRQSAVIVRLKPIGEESFPYFDNISIHDFLAGCGFSKARMDEVAQTLPFASPKTSNGMDGDAFHRVIPHFTKSEIYFQLIGNEQFRRTYEKVRIEGKAAFENLFASLGIPKGAEIGVVDVGWTGRMQDAIHDLTEHPTAGFYIGLKTPASLGEGVSKNGLLFSTIPRRSRHYDLLSINTQIHEQLLMAPHGSVASYTLDEDGNCTVNEVYRDEERFAYQNTVRPVQEFMGKVFEELCKDVRLRVHEWDGDDWLSPSLVSLTLRSGLFADARRRVFLREISRGFVDNFARMGVGKQYDPRHALSRRNLLGFIRRPGTVLKYAVKIQTLENPFLRILLFLVVSMPCFAFFLVKLHAGILASTFLRKCKENS